MTSLLGLSTDLEERGPGLMFRVNKSGRIYPALAIRYEGKTQAYLNVCAHQGLRLNRDKNLFFNRDGNLLKCMSHGAMFEPDSGLCSWRPCEGLSLIPLQVIEEDENILFQDEDYELIED
jgi:nitrite reductase/ring-hydroxylating ferredoxin subunit